MGVCCDLEVDVNGEATFMVDKGIVLSFSGRLRKLIRTTTGGLKIVLHGFPGGSEAFEQVARFCYNNGRVEINPSNVILLHYAAIFLELDQLLAETKKSLQGLNFWSWTELLLVLKQCQVCVSTINDSFFVKKLLDSLIGKLGFTSYESTCSSFSTTSSSFRYSYDTRSHDSSKFTRTTWWFQNLVFLSIDMIQELTKMMVFRNLDHKIICRFLLFYRKSRCCHSEVVQQQRITEHVIDLISFLDHQILFSGEGLFDLYQAALSLKISRKCKHKLEILMGSQLEQLTVSHLLVPAPCEKDYVYDVNLVLRLLKFFQLVESKVCPSQVCKFEKVARLVDSYLMEVAPDSHLKASKFGALAIALPHSRESHDKLYQAIDLYFQVHVKLSEEEKIRICSALNYSKLSGEWLKHLAQNPKFPCRRAVQSLVSKQYSPIDLFCNSIISKVVRDSPTCTVNENAGKRMAESLESKAHSRSRKGSKCVF